MPYAQHGDTRLWYEAFGDGEPLLLIMGLGGTLKDWGLQIAALSRHYRLIALDNRGIGRSDKPAGPYSTAQMADDAAAVLDAAGAPRAHVLGASLGGLIAQELALRHPRRVHSLILACTGIGPNDAGFAPPAPAVAAALRADRATTPPERLIDGIVENFYHPAYRARVPDLAARLLKLSLAQPQPAAAYHAQLAAYLDHPGSHERLAGLRVPTLVLHGEADAAWPVANARALRDAIAGARLQVIEESAHMFLIEQPRAFNRAVLEFLDSLGATMEGAGHG